MDSRKKATLAAMILPATALTCVLPEQRYVLYNFTDIQMPNPAHIATSAEDSSHSELEARIHQESVPEVMVFYETDQPGHTRIDYDNPAVRRIMELPTYEEGFLEAIEVMCGEINMHAHALLAVIHRETGGTFDPHIVNPDRRSRASGLLQFMPRTARALGTTVQQIRTMGQVEQVQLIRDFYMLAARDVGIEVGPESDLYSEPISVAVAPFIPAALGRGWNYVLVSREVSPVRYELNMAADLDGDGNVTVGERGIRAFDFECRPARDQYHGCYVTRPDVFPWARRRAHRQQHRGP